MKKGSLVVLSGFSGSGKGTLVNALLKQYPSQYALSISATTRQPRDGERDGKEYFFLDKERFETMIKNDEFLEYACYVENYYGTPFRYVKEKLEQGKDVILEIEIQGALAVKKKFPEALLLFVTPPNAEILEKRLRDRGTESDEVVKDRLKRAAEEAEYMQQYDFLLVNDELEICLQQMHSIIDMQKEKVVNNNAFVEQIKLDMKQFI